MYKMQRELHSMQRQLSFEKNYHSKYFRFIQHMEYDKNRTCIRIQDAKIIWKKYPHIEFIETTKGKIVGGKKRLAKFISLHKLQIVYIISSYDCDKTLLKKKIREEEKMEYKAAKRYIHSFHNFIGGVYKVEDDEAHKILSNLVSQPTSILEVPTEKLDLSENKSTTEVNLALNKVVNDEIINETNNKPNEHSKPAKLKVKAKEPEIKAIKPKPKVVLKTKTQPKEDNKIFVRKKPIGSPTYN